MKQTDREIISYHTFMLPFTYDGTFNKKENWQEIPFTCKTHKDYNEYVYFYKHVQDALRGYSYISWGCVSTGSGYLASNANLADMKTDKYYNLILSQGISHQERDSGVSLYYDSNSRSIEVVK